MKNIFLLAFIFIVSSVQAMKQNRPKSPKTTALQNAQTFAQQALTEAHAAFKEHNSKVDSTNHLHRAGVCAQLALKSNYADVDGQLASIEQFDKAVQAFQLKNFDNVAAHCFSIFEGSADTVLVKRIRSEAFNLIKTVADRFHHTPSRFYVMKRYLNSSDTDNVIMGLDRLDELDTSNMPLADAKALRTYYSYFGIIEDLNRIAHEQKNPQAQCALALLHLFQAERGEDMDGKPIVVKQELETALALAKSAKKAGYLKAIQIVKDVRESSVALFDKSKIDAPLQRPLKDKRKHDLELFKEFHRNDAAELYAQGKELVADRSDAASEIGIDCLSAALHLGHPFAACLLGDTCYAKDPAKALRYYYKALHLFKSAPRDSSWYLSGKFVLASLERQIQEIEAQKETADPYMFAQSVAQGILFKKELCSSAQTLSEEDAKEGAEYVLSGIDGIAQALHICENDFAHNQGTVETLQLEMLANSGVLMLLDRLKEYQGIQSVLVEALSLRGKLGRGYILKDKNPIAHLEKALHFIIDPAGAAKLPLDAPVSRSILIKKIDIDSLPTQQRILYIHNILAILERMILVSDTLTAQEAQHACALFNICSQALAQTQDASLKQGHMATYSDVLLRMAELARRGASTESMMQVGGALYTLCTTRAFTMDQLEDAYALYTMLLEERLQSKGDRVALKKKLATLTRIKAELAWENGNHEEGLKLLRESLVHHPTNQPGLWQLAQILMESQQTDLQSEGLALLTRLADEYKHHEALKYLARAYCAGVNGITPDDEKAITYLRLVVAQGKSEIQGSSGLLSAIYLKKARKASEFAKKKFLAKAHDIIKDHKHFNDDLHILYLEILYEMNRTKEIELEVQHYCATVLTTDQKKCDLAYAYVNRVNELLGPVRTILLNKVVSLLEPISTVHDRAYILLMQALYLKGDYQILHKLLQIDSKPYLGSMKKSLSAAALFVQHRDKYLESAVELYEEACQLFEEHYISREHTEAVELMTILQSVGGGRILHPWKHETFLELEGVSIVMGQLLLHNLVTDPVQQKLMHAYNAYFVLKMNMLKLSMGTVTLEKVIEVARKSVEAASRSGSLRAHHKLLDQLGKYITLCIDLSAKKVDVESIMCVPSVLKLIDALYMQTKDDILYQSYCTIIEKVDSALKNMDVDRFDQQQAAKITIIQKVVAQYKSNLQKIKYKQ